MAHGHIRSDQRSVPRTFPSPRAVREIMVLSPYGTQSIAVFSLPRANSQWIHTLRIRLPLPRHGLPFPNLDDHGIGRTCNHELVAHPRSIEPNVYRVNLAGTTSLSIHTMLDYLFFMQNAQSERERCLDQVIAGALRRRL
jgi:hypothetical protein